MGPPLLRPLTVQLTLLTFVTMGATDLLIYRVQHDLGRDAATLGYVIAVSGAGSVAAALSGLGCAGSSASARAGSPRSR